MISSKGVVSGQRSAVSGQRSAGVWVVLPASAAVSRFPIFRDRGGFRVYASRLSPPSGGLPADSIAGLPMASDATPIPGAPWPDASWRPERW